MSEIIKKIRVELSFLEGFLSSFDLFGCSFNQFYSDHFETYSDLKVQREDQESLLNDFEETTDKIFKDTF